MPLPTLICDRISAIIAASGHRSQTQLLLEQEYRVALREKLVEEDPEVQAAPLPYLAAELADPLEVIDAHLAAHCLSVEQVRQL